MLGQRIPKPASPDNLSTFDGAMVASQVQTKVAPPTFERKYIARCIHLEKELMTDPIVNEKFYMFRLVTKTLKIIEFSADFSGSLNCEFIEVNS